MKVPHIFVLYRLQGLLFIYGLNGKNSGQMMRGCDEASRSLLILYSDMFCVQAPRCDHGGYYVHHSVIVCVPPFPLRDPGERVCIRACSLQHVSLPCCVRPGKNTNLNMQGGFPAVTLSPVCPAASLILRQSNSTKPDKPAPPAANHLVQSLSDSPPAWSHTHHMT